MNQQLNNNSSNTPEKKKKSGGIVFIIVAALFVFGFFTWLTGPHKSNVPVTQQTNTTKPTETTTVQQGTKENIPTYKVSVTNTAVKNVDGNYRYFFFFKNNDSRSFKGNIVISLLRENGKEIGIPEAYGLDKPLGATKSDSVYFDRSTGPVSEHGEYGVAKFKYTLVIDKVVVGTGEGNIANLTN